jgi:hypothetical protein
MRVATLLLLCLSLTACAGGTLPGEQPAPAAAAASGDTAPPPRAAAPRVNPAARAASPPPQPEPQPEPGPDRVTQARANCWMKVEQQKVRDLDRRIAFVDKCVADALKE